MAYFDDPDKMELWQEELKGLRAERQRRQNKAAEPVQPEPEVEREAEAEFDYRAVPAEWREAAARHSTTASAGPRAERRNSLREEITLEQLEVEAGVKKAPGASVAASMDRTRDMNMDREMN